MSFYITALGRRRRRSVRAVSFNDYKDLALASGGQAIEVSKSQLAQATNIILDTSTSALVRLYEDLGLMKWKLRHSIFVIWFFFENQWNQSNTSSVGSFCSAYLRWQFFRVRGILGSQRPSLLCWMNPYKMSPSTSQDKHSLLHWPTLQVHQVQSQLCFMRSARRDPADGSLSNYGFTVISGL